MLELISLVRSNLASLDAALTLLEQEYRKQAKERARMEPLEPERQCPRCASQDVAEVTCMGQENTISCRGCNYYGEP